MERQKIIELSIKETLDQIKDKKPEVIHNTFFGAFEIEPYCLVIWYFFKTNKDWNTAKNSGFTEEICNLTKSNMIQNGYPTSAFENNVDSFDKSELRGLTRAEKKQFIYDMTHRRVEFDFASEEDVNDKANGNYFYYIK